MITITVADSPAKGIRDVQFEGVRPVKPGSFRIVLSLKESNTSGAYEAAVILSHGDHCSGATVIQLQDYMPEAFIPEFVVNSKALLASGSINSLVELAVMKAGKVSVTLSLDEDLDVDDGKEMISATISITEPVRGLNRFITSGSIMASDAKSHLAVVVL